MLFLDSIVSPFGTAMVQSMSTSRLTYAMSENGFFAKIFLKTNKNAMPKNDMIFNLLIGFLFLLPFPSWQKSGGFFSILIGCRLYYWTYFLNGNDLSKPKIDYPFF